jgi:LmbE family N-acetylglucosaminyl deacetylase
MPSALALAAHPDDIEFMMAGTLLLLAEAGWAVHYMNVSSGNLGSLSMSLAETARVRRREARRASALLGAAWHPPICDDLQIFYEDRTIRRICAVVRDIDPAVILTHSPTDYMEDHMTTARLAVTAAFARGMRGYRSTPGRKPVNGPVTIYHASPHGLRDGLRRLIRPGAFVDTTSVHDRKRAALALHESQRRFLDRTQGMDDYLNTMEEFSAAMGRLSGRFRHAEGWRRHGHLGFSATEVDPLRDALGERCLVSEEYEQLLDS